MAWNEDEEYGEATVVAYGERHTVSLPATLGSVVNRYIRSGKDDVFLNGELMTSSDASLELRDGDEIEIRKAVVAKNGGQ